MPVITFDMGVGQANEEQKRSLIDRLTSESVAITGIPAEKFIVMINEIPHDSLGVGGKTLKDIKAGR